MSNFVIKSVSLPAHLADYIEKNPPLSLSKILQARIIEIMNTQQHFQQQIKSLEIRCKNLQDKLWEANDALDKKNKE